MVIHLNSQEFLQKRPQHLERIYHSMLASSSGSLACWLDFGGSELSSSWDEAPSSQELLLTRRRGHRGRNAVLHLERDGASGLYVASRAVRHDDVRSVDSDATGVVDLQEEEEDEGEPPKKKKKMAVKTEVKKTRTAASS